MMKTKSSSSTSTSTPSMTGGAQPNLLTPSKDFRFKHVGVTHRSKRGKFQARIYKCNNEYNLGLYELAADAAFAYDTAHRLFHLKSKEGVSGQAKIEDTSFVFDWFNISDEECASTSSEERINFLTPSDFRSARSKELVIRFNVAKGASASFKDAGVPTEDELMAKVRKEVLIMTRAVAINTPDVTVAGKRSGDVVFDPQTQSTRRKKSRKNTENAPGADTLPLLHLLAQGSSLQNQVQPGLGNNPQLLANIRGSGGLFPLIGLNNMIGHQFDVPPRALALPRMNFDQELMSSLGTVPLNNSGPFPSESLVMNEVLQNMLTDRLRDMNTLSNLASQHSAAAFELGHSHQLFQPEYSSSLGHQVLGLSHNLPPDSFLTSGAMEGLLRSRHNAFNAALGRIMSFNNSNSSYRDDV